MISQEEVGIEEEEEEEEGGGGIVEGGEKEEGEEDEEGGVEEEEKHLKNIKCKHHHEQTTDTACKLPYVFESNMTEAVRIDSETQQVNGALKRFYRVSRNFWLNFEM
jgi:hypothetical protein